MPHLRSLEKLVVLALKERTTLSWRDISDLTGIKKNTLVSAYVRKKDGRGLSAEDHSKVLRSIALVVFNEEGENLFNNGIGKGQEAPLGRGVSQWWNNGWIKRVREEQSYGILDCRKELSLDRLDLEGRFWNQGIYTEMLNWLDKLLPRNEGFAGYGRFAGASYTIPVGPGWPVFMKKAASDSLKTKKTRFKRTIEIYYLDPRSNQYGPMLGRLQLSGFREWCSDKCEDRGIPCKECHLQSGVRPHIRLELTGVAFNGSSLFKKTQLSV